MSSVAFVVVMLNFLLLSSRQARSYACYSQADFTPRFKGEFGLEVNLDAETAVPYISTMQAISFMR